MKGPYEAGSYVLPLADGNYSLNCETPAQVIEAFWLYKRTPDGKMIDVPREVSGEYAGDFVRDPQYMDFVYKEMDPTTWESVGDGIRLMTEELWAAAVSTRDHPHLL